MKLLLNKDLFVTRILAFLFNEFLISFKNLSNIYKIIMYSNLIASNTVIHITNSKVFKLVKNLDYLNIKIIGIFIKWDLNKWGNDIINKAHYNFYHLFKSFGDI